METNAFPIITKDCYWLGDFERNGYSDSDFFCIWYDASKNTIECIESGSTRYYSNGFNSDQLHKQKMTPELLNKARLILKDSIYKNLKEANLKNVNHPELSFFQLHTKVVASAPIRKKGDDGKFYTIEQGTEFEIVGQPQAFGTFYRNGYNRPNVNNSSIRCRKVNGDYVYLPCHKLKLPDSELISDDVLINLADSISYKGNWLTATSHGSDPSYMGWLSKGVKLDAAPCI